MEPDHLGTQHHAASEVACQQWVNENALRGKAGGKMVKKSKPSGLYVKPVTVHPDKGKPVVQLKHLSKQFQQPIQIENQVKTSVIEPMEVQQSKQKGYGQAWLPRPVGKALDKFNKQMKTKKHQKQLKWCQRIGTGICPLLNHTVSRTMTAKTICQLNLLIVTIENLAAG